jgi:hypothetical protein
VGAGRGGVDDALIFDFGGSEYGNAKRYRTIVPDDMIERYSTIEVVNEFHSGHLGIPYCYKIQINEMVLVN